MKWFLTYPQCSLAPEEALACLKALPIKANIVEYVVAQELHQDGNPHLHCYLKYSSKVSFSSTRWDIADYHGNYTPVASWKAVVNYCKKGGNFIASFDLDAAKSKQAKINKNLLAENPVDLVDNGDISLFQLGPLLKAKALYHSLSAPKKPRAEGLVENSFSLLLPVYSTQTKQRHWWFWSSDPNKGKTTFLKTLDSKYPCHWLSRENFQSIHQATQFVLIDEFTSPWLLATQINSMCDGTYQYPVKGGSAVMLSEPILVVCSNKPPEQVYPGKVDLIKARFSVFKL